MFDKNDSCFLVKSSVTDSWPNIQKIIHELDDVIKEFKVEEAIQLVDI